MSKATSKTARNAPPPPPYPPELAPPPDICPPAGSEPSFPMSVSISSSDIAATRCSANARSTPTALHPDYSQRKLYCAGVLEERRAHERQPYVARDRAHRIAAGGWRGAVHAATLRRQGSDDAGSD